MKELDFTFQPYTDGTIGATMNMYPSGKILANNQVVLVRGLNEIVNAFEKAKASGKKQGELDLPMQGQWIEGRFCVRFLRVPGFGISFDDEQGIKEWLLAFEQGQGKVSA